MKENILKGIAAVIIGGVTAYLNIMAIPLIILISVMIIDYASGMLKAWVNAELSSKTGLKGIIKKVSYLLVICVAAVVDWLVTSGLGAVGINIDVSFCFGVIVTIWFIINECISILENLTILGVPLPSFLTGTVHKLKVAVENKTDVDKEE
ncbi:MAG: phage holin family protein [Ruminococcus sp.]|nr:phage holin family protein [Ruminococcus sp.]